MPVTQTNPSLSLLEQAILVRLRSKSTIPTGELVKAILTIATLGDSLEAAQTTITAKIADLRRRGLITDRGLRPTSAGEKALFDALGVRRKPKWPQFCQSLAARALDLPPGSEQAKQAFASRVSLALAVLRQRAPLPPGATMTAVGDALIREMFGLPAGKITLKRIREHAVMRRLGAQATGNPLVTAASMVQARGSQTAALTQALARRAFERESAARSPTTTAAKPQADDALLSLVHDALPRIGDDGRVGPEKVFVSALWHQIAADRRASPVSLDHFKRWLVRANRDRLVALERADAVGGMDPRLVAESEIEALGTTFHFVVDPRNAAQGARL